MLARFCLITTYFQLIASNLVKENYKENLFVKPLPEGEVYTHFTFTTILEEAIDNVFWAHHYNYFPLSLGKFIANEKIQELHVSLTKGVWKHTSWGYSHRDAPSGAELSVYFQPVQDNPSKAWKEVTSLLSGHFCSSLNFIDKAATVQPVYSLRPDGVVQNGTVRSDLLFYAQLPHEAVCTENLTPWKKLLPCFAKAGLASLLNARHVLNSHFFSLALDIRPICADQSCVKTAIELTQSISVVFNPVVTLGGKQSWSLIKLFGTPLREDCPLASESVVAVDVTSNSTENPFSFTSPPSRTIVKKLKNDARTLAIFDAKVLLKEAHSRNITKFNIGSIYNKDHIYWKTPAPPIHASRYITGHGVADGGITCRIHNELSQSMKILYLDIIPWYLRMYLHTLKITANGRELKPSAFYYKPARDRTQPHHLELSLTLPPKSVTSISFEFDRQHLKWTEYPSDANHGVYVDAAVITFKLPTSRNVTILPDSATDSSAYFMRIHTQSLLVSLPTPDFSMPYNVICLVSTVVSLAFGPIHNLTTRRPQVPEKDVKKGGWLQKIKSMFGKQTSTEEKKTQ